MYLNKNILIIKISFVSLLVYVYKFKVIIYDYEI